MDTYLYDFTMDVQPQDEPTSPIIPPTPPEPQPPTPPKPPEKPDYGPLYPNDQLNRDVAAVRDAFNRGEVRKPLPEWNLTIDPLDIDKWEILDMAISAAGELLFLGTIYRTPGGNEYLQQVQTGMSTGIKSIQTGLRYFTKNPQYAFKLMKDGFRTMGKSFVDDSFMKSLSDRTFLLDPNIFQEALVQSLCKIFPKQVAEIRTLFTLIGSISFLTDPLDIFKSWGNVVYSIFTEGIPEGNYEETSKKFWEAIKETFTPI